MLPLSLPFGDKGDNFGRHCDFLRESFIASPIAGRGEKDELLDGVWKDAFVTPNALTRVVAQLRRALGEDARAARYIETVPTRGYRFIAEIKEKPEGSARRHNDAAHEHEAANERTLAVLPFKLLSDAGRGGKLSRRRANGFAHH